MIGWLNVWARQLEWRLLISFVLMEWKCFVLYNTCNFHFLSLCWSTFEMTLPLSRICFNISLPLFSPSSSFTVSMLVLSKPYRSFWQTGHRPQPRSPSTCLNTQTSLWSSLSPHRVCIYTRDAEYHTVEMFYSCKTGCSVIALLLAAARTKELTPWAYWVWCAFVSMQRRSQVWAL